VPTAAPMPVQTPTSTTLPATETLLPIRGGPDAGRPTDAPTIAAIVGGTNIQASSANDEDCMFIIGDWCPSPLSTLVKILIGVGLGICVASCLFGVVICIRSTPRTRNRTSFMDTDLVDSSIPYRDTVAVASGASATRQPSDLTDL
jgi:hypothetical protein